MKKKKEDKTNKLKEYYLIFKEAWKDPRKKAGIKLLGYLVFFLVFAVIVRAASSMSVNNVNKNTTEEEAIKESLESYREKQQNLLNNNHNISFEITKDNTLYKINGTLKEDIIEGYLESTDGIKKIIIKEDKLYDITNGNEMLLELDFIMSKLDLDYLVDIMEHNDAFIDDKEIIKFYQYAISIDGIENTMVVYTNDKVIEKIVITDLSSEYILIFDK